MSKKCNNCGGIINEADKFCHHCGKEIINLSNSKECTKCGHQNPADAAFCEKCGFPLSGQETTKKEVQDPKTFRSKGNYSGKMVKGKTSKSWKVFLYTILTVVIVGALVIFIWFKRDPEAGEKLKNIAGGILVAVIFIFFVIRGNKKGRKRRRGGYESDQGVNNDDDYDDYDDSDDSDDD